MWEAFTNRQDFWVLVHFFSNIISPVKTLVPATILFMIGLIKRQLAPSFPKLH